MGTLDSLVPLKSQALVGGSHEGPWSQRGGRSSTGVTCTSLGTHSPGGGAWVSQRGPLRTFPKWR